MTPTSNELIAKLKQIEKLVQAMLRALSPGPDSGPPDISDKLDERICLQCGKQVKKEQYRRGLCVSDYEATRRRIRAGEFTDAELVESGLMAPAAKVGRAKGRTALDEYGEKRERSLSQDKRPA